MMKKRFVEQFQEGERIDDVFLVKTARLAETRAGKPYLLLELADRTGEIGGPVWDNAEDAAVLCRVGSFIRLRGAVQSYRDKLQLRIEVVRPVDAAEVALADFVAASPYDLEEMARRIKKLVASVENGWVRKLLNRFFQKGEMWERFQTAPAAKGIHHAYVGGLMEHCLSMAGIADMLASHYPGVDRSILMAGVLFHDIGKIKELKEEVGLVDYTSTGRLKGHLVIGSEMVAEQAACIEGFPEDILTHIQHLILSHHGRLEFGSPTLPMTPEAFLLSYIDDLDSKMNLIERLRRKQKEEGWKWSDYQRSLERFLYLSSFSEDEAEAENGDGHPRRQKTLF